MSIWKAIRVWVCVIVFDLHVLYVWCLDLFVLLTGKIVVNVVKD